MSRTTRPLALLTALVALLLSTLAVAPALAGPAPTTVTIKAQGGDFSGKVKSPDKPRCTEGRKVVLKKKRPGKDKTIASDTSGDGGAWSTGNTGQNRGKFYAKAKGDPDCEAAKSEVVKLT